MATFNNGESGSSVRTKINAVLQHTDGTAGELVINEAGADVDFRVESDTNTNALFVDGATGNVGIGTSSPSARLEVYGGSVRSALSAANATTLRGLEIASGTTEFASFKGNASTGETRLTAGFSGFGGFATFHTDGSERMRIDSAGNVGIGTSSPAQELEIAGTEPNIRLNSGGTPSALYGFEITNGTTVDAYLRTRGSTGETQLGSGRSAGWGGHLTFYTDTSERMRLDASGNLLIGTTSSGGSKLRISGLPTSSAGLSAGDVWNDGGTLKIA